MKLYPSDILLVAMGALMLSTTVLMRPDVATAEQAYAKGCGLHDDMAATLTGSYYEKLMAIGLSKSRGKYGDLYELWVGPKATWTILRVQPNGTACLVASGTNWEGAHKPEPKGRGA